MKKRLRKNGNTSLSCRPDVDLIMDYCNQLAQENEDIKAEIRMLRREIERRGNR